MHPTLLQVRNRLVRSVLPVLLKPAGAEDLVRLGSGYGGWWVATAVLRPGAVAYCAGAGEDITFDLALLARGLHVTTFDPTPRAMAHVAAVAPESEQFRFEPIGWWDTHAELKFYAPTNPAHVSHSATNLQGTNEYFTATVEPVHEIASRLGDDHIALIKMDIEGAEYRVLNSLVAHGPVAECLCVEFDQPAPMLRTRRTVRLLGSAGYRLVKLEGFNATFVRP